MLGNVIAGEECNGFRGRPLDSYPLNSLSNCGLPMIARWLNRLTFVATKRCADIWKREDLASRRGVGRYRARIDAAKSENGVHHLLQRRDAQSAAQSMRPTSRNLARLRSTDRADRPFARRNSRATER